MNSAQRELELAVAASSPIEAMLAACRAWKSLPSTRLALVARGLAAQVPGDAVPGANPQEREAMWNEVASTANPVDLQALLATPWSKNPKDALVRLAHLRRLGPDPRTVGALLELDTGGRYASAAGSRFWQDVYELLLSWGSMEAAQKVPRELTSADYASPWNLARYRGIFEPLVLRWAGRWPSEPALSPSIDALLTQLEARLQPRRELMRGLLASVHGAPREDTPKLVFADALTEQGDPRGEFIALQFAHAAGELTLGKRERMQRLLSASGVSWFDGLAGQVAPLAVFHKGFLIEVRLETRTPDATLPAWRTIEVIDTASIAAPLSGFVNALPGVRSLRGLRGATLEELAREGDARRYEVLEVGLFGNREFATPKWTVERLRLRGHVDQALWWFLGSPLRTRVAGLQFSMNDGFERVGATVRALDEKAPDVEVIEFAARTDAWPTAWHGDWKLSVAKTKQGLTGTLSLGAEVLTGLEAALSELGLRTLSVTTVLRRGPAWRASTQDLVQRSVGKRCTAEFELERPTPLPPRPVIHEGR